jgi:hypothetical protein
MNGENMNKLDADPGHEGGDARTWTNGFTLKKTRDGYSWTISIAPTDQSPEAMEVAIDEAARLDGKLRRIYGEDSLKARIR